MGNNAGRSRTLLLITLLAAGCLLVSGAPQRVSKRKIACKTTENAGSCYWTHGRLSAYNGTPTMRLWKIGTKRILAIHSGPGFKLGDDHENLEPEMPENVERALNPFQNVVFADFEVCPLEPERPGVMQDVCIESAKNIVTDP
jgi:hypothetical protein